jgi:hypothetical protein
MLLVGWIVMGLSAALALGVQGTFVVITTYCFLIIILIIGYATLQVIKKKW